jgi:hypothetical protein
MQSSFFALKEKNACFVCLLLPFVIYLLSGDGATTFFRMSLNEQHLGE